MEYQTNDRKMISYSIGEDAKKTSSRQVEFIVVSRLRGLRLAAYVLKCLAAGESESQIADRFTGDRQLVRMWKCFLIHNRWIEKKGAGGWQITSRGIEATNKHRAEKISIQV